MNNYCFVTVSFFFSGELPNGLKSPSTSEGLNIKFTNGLKRPNLNGPICIDHKKKIKIIKNRCKKQYKIKKRINIVHNKEKNEKKCFLDSKINSKNISLSKKSLPVENVVKNTSKSNNLKTGCHDAISESRKFVCNKNSFVINNTQNDLKTTEHYDNKTSESREINCDKKYFVFKNTQNDLKTKYHDKIPESREINGNEKSFVSNNTQNDLKTKHHDKISESREMNDIKNINVANNTHENTFEMVSYINNLVDIVCYFSSIDHKNYHTIKTNNCNEISQNSKRNSSNLSNSTGVPRITIENTKILLTNSDIEFNQSNKITCDDSYLSKQILNEVIDNSLQTKNNLNKSNTEELGVKNIENNASYISTRNEDININENIGTFVTKNSDTLQMRNSCNEIKAKISTFTDNDIKNSGNTHSKNTSDLSNSSNKSSNVEQFVKKITKNSFPELETILNTKDLTFAVRILLLASFT